MSKAAAISIVLALAVGQDGTLLCQAWCDPAIAAASGCHDQSNATDAPSLAGGSCDHDAPSGAAFVKEDVQRSASAPHADHAIHVPRYQFAPATTGVRPGHEPGHLPSLEKRPLATALRI